MNNKHNFKVKSNLRQLDQYNLRTKLNHIVICNNVLHKSVSEIQGWNMQTFNLIHSIPCPKSFNGRNLDGAQRN